MRHYAEQVCGAGDVLPDECGVVAHDAPGVDAGGGAILVRDHRRNEQGNKAVPPECITECLSYSLQRNFHGSSPLW